MSVKYYIDDAGNYIGGFDGIVPDGGVEVDSPPLTSGALWQDGSWVEPTALLISEAKNAIDVAAGNARARFIAQGWEVVEEYRLAQREVEAWRAAGSPSNSVPASITTWASAEGMTDEQAAQGIEAAASNFEQLLISIRGLRLSGKAAVDNAGGDFMAVAQPFIDHLDSIQP